jgi:hypothetical protein
VVSRMARPAMQQAMADQQAHWRTAKPRSLGFVGGTGY